VDGDPVAADVRERACHFRAQAAGGARDEVVALHVFRRHVGHQRSVGRVAEIVEVGSPPQCRGHQGSGHGVIFRVGSGAGFDLVAQDEVGAGVAGLCGGEVLTQLGDSGGGPLGR
jgi:hypothetical protein